jgi:hypothetical protein
MNRYVWRWRRMILNSYLLFLRINTGKDVGDQQ